MTGELKSRLFLIGAAVGLFATAAIALKFYFADTAEELVCEGIDPKTRQVHRLTIANRSNNLATARLYLDQSKEPVLKDLQAVVGGGANDLTVTLNGEKDTNLHFVKACGPKPRCEIHRYQLPPAAQIKKDHENTMHAEREAYEYRTATARQAAEFAKARELAMHADAELRALRSQSSRSQGQLKELEEKARKLNDVANQLADRLYAMSASTHDVHKQASEVRSLASLNRVEVEAQELQVVRPEVWCHNKQ
jgi:hypothetical protein